MKYIIILLFAFLDLKSQIQNPKPYFNPDWSKPYPAFRIVGNLYYVGTYDLACYLITTPKGNILVNTGNVDSYPLIKSNIESLGFSLKDTKILLITQAHYDHTGVLAQIKNETKAKFFANKPDVEVLKNGGKTDYELAKYGETFKPIFPDKVLKNNSVISLGDTKLTMLHHPGHTKGSCSYLVDIKEGDKTYKVLIANMPSIIIDGKFSDVKTYPTIQKDYEYTLNSMKNLRFDLWVASHASQFHMHEVHQPNNGYNPKEFMNTKTYFEDLSDYEKDYQEKLKEESN